MRADRDGIDPSADHMHILQQRFRAKRRRWAWKIGRPYSQDQDREPPAVYDGADTEAG